MKNNRLVNYLGIESSLTNETGEKCIFYEPKILELIQEIRNIKSKNVTINFCDFDIYIILLNFKICNRHFKISPFTERFSKIEINLKIKTKKNSLIPIEKSTKFLNPYIIKKNIPGIEIYYYNPRVKYIFKSSCLSEDYDFHDFLLLFIRDEDRKKVKKVEYTITAFTNVGFRNILQKIDSETITSKGSIKLMNGLHSKDYINS